MSSIQKHLNMIITHALCDPGGDPSNSECTIAARAYLVLKELGLAVEDEEDIVRKLRSTDGEGNIHEMDFLDPRWYESEI